MEAVIGTARRTAFALSVIGLPIVHRGTVRAMLPAGRIKYPGPEQHRTRYAKGMSGVQSRGKSAVTGRFQDALREFEREGWISRGTEFVLVKNSRALLDYAMRDLGNQRPEHFIQIASAIEHLSAVAEETDRPEAWVEQRRQELIALQQLMAQGFGTSNWSGAGSVRFLPRGKTI